VRRLATVDLGTNTVRLLVVEAVGGLWRALHEAQRITRLGEGQGAACGLLEAPMERTAAAVAEYVDQARQLGASEIRIAATSAVRVAPNGREFVRRLEALTGGPVEVISGEREAGLMLLGVSAGLPRLPGSFVVFDIGGGSTEFVLAADGRPALAKSLRLGVVSLAERFMDGGPVDWERYAQMSREVGERLERELPEGIRTSAATALVGTAGTVTTLAALDLGLARYEAARVQGHVLTREAVERQLARTGNLALHERARLPCLEIGRADVLIPGIAVCLATMAVLGFGSVIVSDWGLREGLLCELLGTR
jgi:exopolyphosphatase/guanosine-5'-triphosphate,3'-diphosphate pyrophosphatase